MFDWVVCCVCVCFVVCVCSGCCHFLHHIVFECVICCRSFPYCTIVLIFAIACHSISSLRRRRQRKKVCRKNDSIEYFLCCDRCFFFLSFLSRIVKVMVFDAARRKILLNNHKFEDKKLNIKIEICGEREREAWSLCVCIKSGIRTPNQAPKMRWNWWQENECEWQKRNN